MTIYNFNKENLPKDIQWIQLVEGGLKSNGCIGINSYVKVFNPVPGVKVV